MSDPGPTETQETDKPSAELEPRKQALVGKQVEIGTALVHFYEPRTPCHKMDAIAPGLCELMKHGRQGVMAEVIRDGVVRVGDAMRVVSAV